MRSYVLSIDAENDLREIAQYTFKNWGESAFEKYKSGLSKKMYDIAHKRVQERHFSKAFPQLRVTKYRYHFIFDLSERVDKPVIIGVIHEQRDIVNRLKNRLS